MSQKYLQTDFQFPLYMKFILSPLQVDFRKHSNECFRTMNKMCNEKFENLEEIHISLPKSFIGNIKYLPTNPENIHENDRVLGNSGFISIKIFYV